MSHMGTVELLNDRLWKVQDKSGLILPSQELELLDSPKVIEEDVKNKVQNILGINQLSELICMMISYGAIDVSDNPGNKYFEEIETKVLDVDMDKFMKRIDDLIYYNALDIEQSFSGEIDDIYLASSNKAVKKFLSKRKATVRVRFKIDKDENGKPKAVKLLLTLKRRQLPIEIGNIALRKCFEEEFSILDPSFVFSQLQSLGFMPEREKIKNRNGIHILNTGAKIDSDDYGNSIRPLSEIELPGDENIVGDRIQTDEGKVAYVQMMMDMCGWSDKKTAAYGSRKLHSLNGEDYTYLN